VGSSFGVPVENGKYKPAWRLIDPKGTVVFVSDGFDPDKIFTELEKRASS